MVTTIDHLASSAGLAMLLRGGSAADAAIAANAVLAITAQYVCGMGGDLFALVHIPGGGTPAALNSSGRAGSGADPARLRDEGHAYMPPSGDIRSVPMPGCVDGWLALHERFGRLELAEVLDPARRLASDGFPATPAMAAAAARVADAPGGEDYKAAGDLRPGTVIRRPGMAKALADIAARGRDGWYGGEFGENLLELGAGEYTPEDLADPLADWVDPLAADAWDHRLWTIPPNSQGYLTLASSWIASGLDLSEPESDQWAHLLVECCRQAGWDRERVLHEHADGEELVSERRLAPRRDAIDPVRAGPLGWPSAVSGTTSLCVIDSEGMGVSLIQSNAAGFGSGLVVPGVRVFLQNRGVGFSLEPGHPAEYGPRKRPPHTLAPLLVTARDGALRLLANTMGGDSQPQILTQLLARRLHAGQDVGAAIAAGRWRLRPTGAGLTGFDTWRAGGAEVAVSVEGHAPEAWIGGLQERGHTVSPEAAHNGMFGHAELIAVAPSGVLSGAADPRALGSSVSAY
ncbi:MAG: gamma-glutamyltransferase [Actinobacteria bacterium]|nr:gamma-glutamyltransferase [Actinomycetota bacterium]